MERSVRMAVDIGGTFTDVVLEHGDRQTTSKVLTTRDAPEAGVLDGIRSVLAEADVAPSAIALFVHGTTLATNAIIERKGAATALLTTAGFRDSVEMAHENRFEQYDIFMDKPEPLVPRHLRLPITERMSATGDVLIPLDEDSVRAVVPELRAEGATSVAIGFLHSYIDPTHERRAREVLREELADIAITLSSEVCPEIREYERLSTACANAYVQPLMARYLRALDREIRELGLVCPFLLMQSGGGLGTLEGAIDRPVNLVESGPAGGAVLAAFVAETNGLDNLLSFDMGGTTAKICLIENGVPRTSREFEVARIYRFLKGSGLPLRMPVIEMVEIGAGGGSIATVDSLGRITVGPESAAGDPGPAAYGRGGQHPTVTDADVALGRIDPAGFAGGELPLDANAAGDALAADVGEALGMTPTEAAFGVSEMVDENMANAARVHAIEQGRDIGANAMIAFGGAAPLHATRLADKLGIDHIVVPAGAGVGSAIGFLRAPVAYEAVRTRYQRLDAFDLAVVNELLADMRDEARKIVEDAAPGSDFVERGRVFMRYAGQGHEISVPLPGGEFTAASIAELRESFDREYRTLFTRVVPGLELEILSWVLTLSTVGEPPPRASIPAPYTPDPNDRRPIFDPAAETFVDAAVHRRTDLAPGARIVGPAAIEENQTTTIVSRGFTATVDDSLALVLTREAIR